MQRLKYLFSGCCARDRGRRNLAHL